MINWEAVDRAMQKAKSNFGYKDAEYDKWCRLNDVKLKYIHDIAITACANKKEKEEMATNNLHTAFLSRYDLYSGKVKVKIGNRTYIPTSVTMERSDKEHDTWSLEVDSRNYIHTDGEDIPQIKNVIFNPPATIVFWKDGSKTVVKADGEEFDAEKGLAMAFSKKFLGNKYDYYNTFKHWLKRAPDYKKEK